LSQIDLINERLKRLKGGTEMSDDFELVRGSGDVFRDLDLPIADRQQLRTTPATEIIGAIAPVSCRPARPTRSPACLQLIFPVSAKAALERFTVDHLMEILGKLDRDIEVLDTVGRRPPYSAPALA
jgi:hypothetical protein